MTPKPQVITGSKFAATVKKLPELKKAAEAAEAAEAQRPDPVTDELIDDTVRGVVLVIGLLFSGVHMVRRNKMRNVLKRVQATMWRASVPQMQMQMQFQGLSDKSAGRRQDFSDAK